MHHNIDRCASHVQCEYAIRFIFFLFVVARRTRFQDRRTSMRKVGLHLNSISVPRTSQITFHRSFKGEYNFHIYKRLV
jgi:hypothetical protein